MAVSVQVLYPVGEGTTFDYDYYLSQHMAIVGDVMGEHIESTLVTKGLAGGPGVPAGYHAIATIVFANQSAMDAALASVGPALEDIPNFTNTEPQMLIGEVVG
ncbi:MAG: EthD family reductase [Arenicellales bacterium]|nr:EthD family reductase [Arenicellales bacterium]|tara:strand:- start:151 stop:459 length:309 start_codon:yes stop_codon:yes gene_type:complete